MQSCCLTKMTGEKNHIPNQLKCCFHEQLLPFDYTSFDCYLLYTLIRQLCPSLRPTEGWGIKPRYTDTLIGIERLRLLLSSFCSCPTQMSDDKLEDLLRNVKSVFHRFQNFTKEWSSINYVQQLTKLERDILGFEDLEEDNQPVKLTFILSEQPEDKGK